MTRTETKGEREKDNDNIEYNAVIAHTKWRKLLHKFFLWALNCLIFLGMHYLKWMHILKTWLNRFFGLFRNETRIFVLNWN